MTDDLRNRVRQDYDLEMLNNLLDYIEQVEKTEHGLDGAVREIARRAATLRGPIFHSGRARSRAAIEPAPVSVETLSLAEVKYLIEEIDGCLAEYEDMPCQSLRTRLRGAVNKAKSKVREHDK